MSSMRRLACAVCVLLVLAVPAIAQTDQFLITPGEGIGQIQIGMSVTDATRILGTPKPATTKIDSVVLPIPEGTVAFRWDASPEVRQQGGSADDGFEVITDKTGTVYEVQGSFDNRYHTAEGLHVGSKPSDVTDALSTPSRELTNGHERFYVYDNRGIAFLTQNNRRASNYGLVNGIWIFAPR